MNKLSEILRAATSIAALGCMVLPAANASIITIGKGQKYSCPYYAAPKVQAGDTVEIFPGTYGGAWFWSPDITIIGMGPGVILTGAPTQGKGLLVLSGKNVTVQNITFLNAQDGNGNGAGIWFGGTNLTVLNDTFINNQNGILTAPNKASTIIVKNSTFTGNGTCIGAHGCGHAIYAGAAALLDVENSTFTDTKQGHHIKSRANNTVIVNNRITDGPTGTSSYLIDIPNGGAVTITGNYLEKGPKSSNYSYAITMGEEGATNPAGPMLVANNTYVNDDKPGVFVHNQTGNADLLVSNNRISGAKTTVLQGKGTATGNVTTTVSAAAMAAVPGTVSGSAPSSGNKGAQVFGPNVTTGAVPLPNDGVGFMALAQDETPPAAETSGAPVPERPWLIAFSGKDGTVTVMGQGFALSPSYAGALWGSDSSYSDFAQSAGASNDLLGLAGGGTFGAVGMRLGHSTRIATGWTSTQSQPDAPRAFAASIGLTTKLTQAWTAGVTLQYLHEALGATPTDSTGTFGFASSSRTLYVGVGSSLRLAANTSLIVNLALAQSSGTGVFENSVYGRSTLLSRSYEVGLIQHHVFRADDSLSISASKPLRAFSGSLGLATPDMDWNGMPVAYAKTVGLVPQGNETDLSLGYARPLANGIDLHTAFGSQFDAGNARGRTAAFARVQLRIEL